MLNNGINFDKNVVSEWSLLSESHYINMVIKVLDEEYCFFEKNQIHVRSSNPAHPPKRISLQVEPNKRTLLIYLSEEVLKELPDWILNQYDIIFRQYNPVDSNRVLSLPLGYEKSVADLDGFIVWENREIDTFFSGAINVRRMPLYKAFFGFKVLPNRLLFELLKSKFGQHFDLTRKLEGVDIQFNLGWKQGLNSAEYSKKLGNSKISLCPKGYSSSETYRHFESMRKGCIVISDQLPDTWIYKNAPIIQIDSWRQIKKTIKKLLESEQECLEIHNRSLEFWNSTWSPVSLARRISSPAVERSR